MAEWHAVCLVISQERVMRVLLIYPDTDPLSIIPSGLINIEPLGLEYLAGELNDHDVTILDMKIERHWREAIDNFRPDIVGITGTVVHTHRILSILDYVKQILPEAITIVGGTHASLVPSDFFRQQVDIVIPGKDSAVFRRVVESIDRKRSLYEIAGIIIRSDNGWKKTAPSELLRNLDSLPIPRRDLTAQYRTRYHHLVWKPVALMVTSVGCPHGCSFCPCPVLTGRKVLRRSPELVLEELRQIDEPYVYIGDDNLFYDHHHARRIAQLIEGEGLKKQYYVLGRADDIVKHPELIERWAAIGLKKVFLGLESPGDDEIKALNKRATVAGNNRAIEILHSNNIDPLGAFIVDPRYTRADFDRILEYMDRMRIYYFEFTVLTPFPGTKFYEEVRDGLVSHDTRLFDLAHSLFPTCLPATDFYREFHRLHRRAASLRRALWIRPVVSPFRRMAFVPQATQVVELFFSARRAYRQMQRADVIGTNNVFYNKNRPKKAGFATSRIHHGVEE